MEELGLNRNDANEANGDIARVSEWFTEEDDRSKLFCVYFMIRFDIFECHFYSSTKQQFIGYDIMTSDNAVEFFPLHEAEASMESPHKRHDTLRITVEAPRFSNVKCPVSCNVPVPVFASYDVVAHHVTSTVMK